MMHEMTVTLVDGTRVTAASDISGHRAAEMIYALGIMGERNAKETTHMIIKIDNDPAFLNLDLVVAAWAQMEDEDGNHNLVVETTERKFTIPYRSARARNAALRVIENAITLPWNES